MLDIIQLLPDSIANQIAAGEVVQRPASVVKELMENSIDAKSTSVQLIIREAGKVLIQVIDDGIGMSETDARMCFERHATSKIRTSDDIFHIKTMGFRGEAMASIAAVAQVEMKTRREADELGFLIRIEASELKAKENISTPKGTSTSVKNLFYNVPARRNFLKSNPIEMRHILDEFQRIALANPEIAFSLYHNDAEIYNLSPEKLSRRIIDLFGKNYREQLAYCEEITDFVSVKGYIGKPANAKKSRGEQFFFANNRFIKNGYLNHAIMTGFEGLIPSGTFPFYVLFIEIDPIHIDINVHPTKTEIKFDDERTVYAVVQAAVRRALSQHNLAPSLDFEVDVNFGKHFKDSENLGNFNFGENPSKSNTFETKSFPSHSNEKSNLSNWNKLYEGLNRSTDDFENQKTYQQSSLDFPIENSPELTISSKINSISENQNISNNLDKEVTTFQIHQKYIISQVKSGMLLIDQQAAFERIIFDRLARQLESKLTGASQQLLFPKEIHFSKSDLHIIQEIQLELKDLGFNFEIEAEGLLIRGVPIEFTNEDEKSLIDSLLEQYDQSKAELSISKSETIAKAMAKRTATLKSKEALSVTEMNFLVEQLFSSSNASLSPSGKSTMKILSLEEIATFFQ